MINKTNINLYDNVSKGVTRSSLLLLSKLKGLTPLNLPRVNKSYLVALLDSHVIHYPSPITLTYAWSFGALAGICLVIQILSGIFLAMHYTPNIELAFNSVEHIMRDVNNGWLISTLAQVRSSGKPFVPQKAPKFDKLPEPARTFVDFVLDFFYYLILLTFFVLSILYKSYLVTVGFVVFLSFTVLTSEKARAFFGTSSHIISEVDKIYKSKLGGALYYGVYLTKISFLFAYSALVIVAESHYSEIKTVILSGAGSSSELYWVFLTDLSRVLQFFSPVFVAAIMLEFLVKLVLTVQFKPTLLSSRKRFRSNNLIKGRRFSSGGLLKHLAKKFRARRRAAGGIFYRHPVGSGRRRLFWHKYSQCA
jgi:hypothetical protein